MKLNGNNELKNGNRLFAFWANNRGRGSNNCTLQVVPAGTIRRQYSKQTTGIIAQTRCSSWRGIVNMSKRVCGELGINCNDVIL